MRLRDLVTEPGSRKLSQRKLWTNVAYLVATVVVLWHAWTGQLTETVLVIYLAVVGGSALASKVIAARFGATPPTDPPEPR
ncbi:MAG TPA: hypothetical protein VF406_11800 [Thermodesulfobacteriota bacterium]